MLPWPSTKRRQMNYIRFDDWHRLPGTAVEIWRNGALLRRAVIDAATDDSTVAWAAADANEARCLLDKASGFEPRLSPEQALLRRRFTADTRESAKTSTW